jgi:predicted RNA binding protein YcfA (HicA-like mRNA interferase family)
MKMPRDINSIQLIKALKIFEYEVTRQVGSHIRLTTTVNGQHHITIPNHDPLKIGSLSPILTAIASHQQISKEELITKLFYN